MRAAEESTIIGQSSNPVDEARTAIWRLFQEGYVDEDMATAGLLAVDLGTRRTKRDAAERREGPPPHDEPGIPVAR
jgi:hypothetical protein